MRLPAVLSILVLAIPADAHWSPAGKPASGSLLGVCALAPSSVWTVGDSGSAYYSNDGGATWVRQNTPFLGSLSSVSFATPLCGWMSGEGGAIAYTDSAGGRWTPQNLVADDLGLGAPDIAAPVRATSACCAWALARWGDVSAVCHTVNAGSSWASIPFTKHGYHDPNTVHCLAVASDQQVWLLASRLDERNVYVPVLLQSDNTGATWQTVPLPASALDQTLPPDWDTAMGTTGPDDVYTAIHDRGSGASVLFHTTRNAETGAWQTAATFPGAIIRSISVPAGTHGSLVGDITAQTTDDPVMLRRTLNPGGLSLCADFASPSLGFAAGPDGSMWRWEADGPGDANGNGAVDLPDAVMALSMALSGQQPDPLTKSLSDIVPPGGDGTVTIADAVAIVKIAGGLK